MNESSQPLVDMTEEQRLAVALNDLRGAGLPDVVWSDGPNGVRDALGATAFPSELALAATFSPELARRFGEAVARECLAAGRNAMLGPGLDIARVPWAGRLSETLGEDPILSGTMGAAIVRGIQSGGVLAVPKHFIANNFEELRTGRGSFFDRSDAVDVRVEPEVLRDIYAEPFRRALLEGGAGGVLTSYNRINGEYASQSAEVFAILRDEWGWEGLVVPDFIFAVRDDEAALRVGLDLPALGGPANRTEDMVRRLPAETLDRLVGNVVAGISSARVEDPREPELPLDDKASQELAQEILEHAAVLLKNDGILPLSQRICTAVVIGSDAPTHLIVMGGSAAVALSPGRVGALATALIESAGLDVRSVAGGNDDVPVPTVEIPTTIAIMDAATGDSVVEERASFELFGAPEGIGASWSAKATATYVPEASGNHRMSVTVGGEATVFIDDVPLATGKREATRMIAGPEYPLQFVVSLERGLPVRIRLEYEIGPSIAIPGLVTPGFKLGVAAPSGAIAAAASAAAEADIAIVIAGRVSGEAMDIESIRLPGEQDALIRAVAAANPKTIVVTAGAGPIAMPWIDEVAAVLHVWTPGERFGPGVARLLSGRVEPTGRLPITFPTDDGTTPVSSRERYPGEHGVVRYSEGHLVGYRWYQATGAAPLFPFGHGLGYSRHECEIRGVSVADGSVTIDVDVTNVSDRDGDASVQVYVASPSGDGDAVHGLKAFAKVRVSPATTERVRITFAVRDLARFHVATGDYRVASGRYEIAVGTSSTDIHSRTSEEFGEHVFASSYRG